METKEGKGGDGWRKTKITHPMKMGGFLFYLFFPHKPKNAKNRLASVGRIG